MEEIRKLHEEIKKANKIIEDRHQAMFGDWKKIKGYKRYSISKSGQVRNDITGLILKPLLGKAGYKFVELYHDKKGKFIKIHRLVALAFIDNPLKKKCVDHINNNKGDNRLENLRWVTQTENSRNSKLSKSNKSGVKGVYYMEKTDNWRAIINNNYKTHHIGMFNTLGEAKEARQKKAKELFGEHMNSCEL